MSKWTVTSGKATSRKVLVYMRGAIVECWQVGRKFLPLHSYKRFEFKNFAVAINVEKV